MKKIKTVFLIDRDLHRATGVVQENWVLEGEGLATIKFDGTSTMVKDGQLYKRYDAKGGKTPPEGFVPAEAAPDIHTGHWRDGSRSRTPILRIAGTGRHSPKARLRTELTS